ncbi:hypothetical protein AX15_007578 [Amanita polypyramis BW_CC]|nr:hypothetical protein AX15_007578 [Amanita polypyramis BW_CC]
MPIVTIVAGLSPKANDAIFVLLIILVLIIFASLFAFIVAKGINLYKEHKETEALARKVWDTEAKRIEEEEKEANASPASRSRTICGTHRTGDWSELSLIPSLPPIVESSALSHYIAAFPAPPTFLYDRPIVTRAGGEAVSVFNGQIGTADIRCSSPGRPALPWADLSMARDTYPAPALYTGSCLSPVSEVRNSHQGQSAGAHGSQSRVRPLVPAPTGLEPLTRGKPRRSTSVDRRVREAEERKVLCPLSTVDVERRRSNRRGVRRNGPRTAGKENKEKVGRRRTASVDERLAYCRHHD